MWACRFVVAVLFVFLINNDTVAQEQFAYRITFKDKVGTSSLVFPSDYLSSRALARRSAASIVVDSLDLPVSPSHINAVVAASGGVYHCASKWLNTCVILVSNSELDTSSF